MLIGVDGGPLAPCKCGFELACKVNYGNFQDDKHVQIQKGAVLWGSTEAPCLFPTPCPMHLFQLPVPEFSH